VIEPSRGQARWRFHFSSVLWLGASGVDFDGGALAFYNNHSTPWLTVEPEVGRAAVFSSGWENVHGIRPVRRGRRWALTVMIMVHEEQSAQRPHRGRDFRDHCVRPTSRQAYSDCRLNWASAML
jgi:predicted 2-oxoglutarate/Fe(II)-dependent dioxygenase YbiX